MDTGTSSSTSRAYIRDPLLTGKPLGRVGDKDKSDEKFKTATYRSTRYKEKFQALREKYDQVNSKHEEYQRDLDTANKRIKRLQAENDLLLDAMNLAVPSTLVQLIMPQQHDLHGATTPDGHPYSNSRTNASPHLPPSHTNGVGNGSGNVNGNGPPRHRSLEHDGPQTEYVSHETNGRAP